MSATVQTPLTWAVATSTFPGEESCGDLHLVTSFETGTLVALLDGLGHGSEAYDAAKAAVDTLAVAPQLSIPMQFHRCHQALYCSRGVAMTLASIKHDGTLEWFGVGNVEAVVVPCDRGRAREHVPLRGGIVGYGDLPRLATSTLQLRRGDVMVLATDGVHDGFASLVDPGCTPAAIADLILREQSRGTDDALVLVARYEGASR